MDDEILNRLKGLHYDIPTDLIIIMFTSVSLSIAEYSYQSKSPVNIEQLAELIFKIMLQGSFKTLGLLKNGD